MDRYKDGALAEAIGYWEPIYRELGEEKGYRLAYDLGVGYAEIGDATHAAERLQSFLAQTAARKARGEPVEAIVVKEEEDSEARIGKLMATRGRIRIEAGEQPCAAQVDASEPRLAGYVAWVSPGRHSVTFAPATQDAASQTVDVAAGELVTLSRPPSPGPRAGREGLPPPATPPAPWLTTATPPPSEPSLARGPATTHPFPPVLIAVSGGLALAAGIAAVPLDSHAWTLRSRDMTEQQETSTISKADRQSFADARTQAYAAIGIGIGFAALTAGLSAWYFLGTRHSRRAEVIAAPTGMAWRF